MNLKKARRSYGKKIKMENQNQNQNQNQTFGVIVADKAVTNQIFQDAVGLSVLEVGHCLGGFLCMRKCV